MRTPIFQIDAFTNRRFAGNPAAVMPMDSFPADTVLQAIAAENNLAETAFLVPNSGGYHLRWFTPTTEVPLCGHATLASAAVPVEVLTNSRDYLALMASAAVLRTLTPDMAAIARIERSGVIVTAQGDEGFDFISRYFAPAIGVPEDPVTGAV